MLEGFLTFLHSEVFQILWEAALASLPVWLPALLLVGWFDIYMNYKRRVWIKNEGSTLLEIKVPRELPRSPQAMELFLHTLHQAGVGNLVDVYGKGRVRSWFSLELVSIEGSVRFFVWTHKKFKGLVESQLYAQFPDIEVYEVADYAKGVHHDPEKLKFGWIGQFALTQADAYPIKTYVDYGLDKDPKEEYKHDPLTSVLEYLGSLGPGEQAWIQILVQGHGKEGLKHGRLFAKPDWKKAAEKEIESIKDKSKPKEEGKPSSPLSKGQQDAMAAIERSISKFAFDTMIRATYFAEVDRFDSGKIAGLLGSWKQFSSNTMNGFKPSFSAGKLDYPWQDFRGRKKLRWERQLLEAYKRRSFFNPPFKNFYGKPFILTTEEIATIFHFPSEMVASTPSLARVPSKKSEAPSNLPI